MASDCFFKERQTVQVMRCNRLLFIMRDSVKETVLTRTFLSGGSGRRQVGLRVTSKRKDGKMMLHILIVKVSQFFNVLVLSFLISNN